MKNSVWVLTSGSYSDYSVVGVFSTLEIAKDFSKRADNPQHPRYNDPFECGIDEFVEPVGKGLFPYTVDILFDGRVLRTWKDTPRTGFGIHSPRLVKELRPCGSPWDEQRLVFEVWSRNEEHAVKIANDGRIRWLSEQSVRKSRKAKK